MNSGYCPQTNLAALPTHGSLQPGKLSEELSGPPPLSISPATRESEEGSSRAHDLQLTADQGNAAAHNNHGICLRNGDGVSINLRGAAHYFKLAADQGIAAA
jgi:TPR repeat protein